jgi:hypothetical protein
LDFGFWIEDFQILDWRQIFGVEFVNGCMGGASHIWGAAVNECLQQNE